MSTGFELHVSVTIKGSLPQLLRSAGEALVVTITLGHARRSQCGADVTEIAADRVYEQTDEVLTLDRLLNCCRRDRTLWAPSNSQALEAALVGTGRPSGVPVVAGSSFEAYRNGPVFKPEPKSDGLRRPYVNTDDRFFVYRGDASGVDVVRVHYAERRGEVFRITVDERLDRSNHQPQLLLRGRI
jgi:hypothetical protein